MMLDVEIKRDYSCFSSKRIQGDQNCSRVSEGKRTGFVHIGVIVQAVFRDIQRRYMIADLTGPELLMRLRLEIKRRGIRRRHSVDRVGNQ